MRRLLAGLCACFAWAAKAQVQYNWTDVTPAGGGVASVGTHVLDWSRLVALGTFQPGGRGTAFYSVMYSEDAGRSWKLPLTPLPTLASGLFVDVALPGVVYLTESGSFGTIMGSPAHEGHLYRSDDFGRSWSVVHTTAIGEDIIPFATDPLDVRGLYASYGESYLDGSCPGFCVRKRFTGITRSRDDGFDWSAPSALPLELRFFVGPTPTAQRRLFAASPADGVYVSVDGSATWSKFSDKYALASGLRWIRPDPLQPDVLYAGLTYPSVAFGIFYSILVRSDNGGATWREISNLGPSFAQLAIDPARPNVVWVTGESRSFYRSEDRGNTWYGVPYPAGQGSVALPDSVTFSPAGPNVVYVIQGARLFRGTAVLPQPIVVEYEYEGDRYWLASHDGEKVSQDNRQEPGHVHRTGQRWGAWINNDAPPGVVGSCRFWPKPAIGRTRVLVQQGFKCDALKRDAGWILEAENEFFTLPPANDACPGGSVPVRRFHNLKADFNHRWVADPEAIAEMRARGWYDEGVRFCARPLGPNE